MTTLDGERRERLEAFIAPFRVRPGRRYGWARTSTPEAARKGDVWERRYREINDWERYLSDNGSGS